MTLNQAETALGSENIDDVIQRASKDVETATDEWSSSRRDLSAQEFSSGQVNARAVELKAEFDKLTTERSSVHQAACKARVEASPEAAKLFRRVGALDTELAQLLAALQYCNGTMKLESQRALLQARLNEREAARVYHQNLGVHKRLELIRAVGPALAESQAQLNLETSECSRLLNGSSQLAKEVAQLREDLNLLNEELAASAAGGKK